MQTPVEALGPLANEMGEQFRMAARPGSHAAYASRSDLVVEWYDFGEHAPYAMMRGRAEVAAVARAMSDRNNNQPPMSGIFPDYTAPVVARTEEGSREMRDV